MRGVRSPLAVQIAEGDPQKVGKHKLEERLAAEPKAEPGLPECPDYIEGRARKAWQEWKECLEFMEMDRRPDAIMLEGACTHYARAVEADLDVKREGLTVETRVGTRINPSVRISQESWRLVHKFCSEFGLSPVSRMKLPHVNREPAAAADLKAMLAAPRERRSVPVVQ